MECKGFTLKHCLNGFVFGYWKENGMMQGLEYVEEVVTEDVINDRIGEFLKVKAQVISAGTCLWYVECSRMTPNKESEGIPIIHDELMTAKLAFVHAKGVGITNSLVVLKIKDNKTPRYEIIGKDAEYFATSQNIKIGRKHGVPIIKLDCSSETGKLIGDLRPCVIETSEDEILQWYKSTRLEEDCP